VIDRYTYTVIEHHSNDSLGWTAIGQLGTLPIRRHATFTSRREADDWVTQQQEFDDGDYERYRTGFISRPY
jgi:hypothetical protein